MPGNSKTLQLASGPDNQAVKPVPPADLWERLDAEVSRMNAEAPEGAFTIPMFRERYRVTEMVARRMVGNLCRDGIIREVGRFGNRNSRYFIQVKDDSRSK